MIALVLLLLLDVVHLKNGGKIEGKVVEEKDGKLRIRTATGEVVVARDDVARIEAGPSPAEELAERRAKLDGRDPKAVLDLAKWAASKGLAKEALEVARGCDAPECREWVAQAVEPDVRRRLDEASRALKLGLIRRAKELLAALEADVPEAKDRARALLPKDPAARGRYDGIAVDRRVEDAVNAYFAEGRPVEAQAPLAEILAAVRRGMRPPAGAKTGRMERKTPEGTRYLLRVPRGYDGETPLRLLVSLHGSGGTAEQAEWAWGESLDGEADLIVAFPDGGLAGWGNSRAGHDNILSVVRDVSRHYAIDPDRVCLDGASMGAHGSFFLAMYHPGRWAAIAPRAGSARAVNQKSSGGVPDISPAPAMLDNLWATPVYLIAGAKDLNSPVDEVRVTKRRLEGLGAPLVYREYADRGHEWFRDEDRDVLDFLRHHVRDPYPARVRFTTREPAFGRCLWVEILEASRPLRIEITHVDMKGDVIETRKEYDRPVEVDAAVDRAKNRVTVKASGAKELRIWLADELVDLDKPVRVVLNDAVVFDGKVERSLKAALEDCRKRADRGAVYVASVTVRAK
jgi:dienelactone hydrolase